MKDEKRGEKEVVIEVGDPEEASDAETTIWVGETEFEDETSPEKEAAKKRKGEKARDERLARDASREKSAKKKKTRDGPPKEKRAERERTIKRRTLGILLVAALLVLTGVVAWFELAPVPLDPVIDAPQRAVAGDLVLFSANNSSGRIVNYTWEFGDGAIAYGVEQEHVYKRSDTRTVTLTIADEKGRTAKETASIEILPLLIVLPEERYGEEVVYDVWNYVSLYNPDGITTVDASESELYDSDIELRRVDMWMNGTTTSRLTTGGLREDGFLEEKETINKSSHHQLQVQGVLDTSSGTGRVTGPLTIWESSFSELKNNITLQTLASSISTLKVAFASKDTDVVLEDTLAAYPDPETGDRQLSVEYLKDDKTFLLDETGLKSLGGIAYIWEIRSADRIGGHPCLVLDITIDGKTMEDNMIENFSLQIWISNATFMPLRTILDMKQVSEGNETNLRTENIMRSINPGTTLVEYQQGIPVFIGSWAEKNEAIGGEFSQQWSRVPPHNLTDILRQTQDAISQDFTIVHALDIALSSQETGLEEYILSNPDAYCTLSRYGKSTLSQEWWNMTFHSPGSMGRVVNVTLTRSPLGQQYDQYSFISFDAGTENVTASENIEPMLSFQGAQLIFREHPGLDNIIRNNKLDIDKGYIGTEANISLPVVTSSTSLFSSPEVEYGYVIHHAVQTIDGFSKTTQAAIDAETGRFLYVWTHRDNSSGSPI